MNWLQTFNFWNSPKNVSYFRDKPADFRIRGRLERLLGESVTNNGLTALDLGCGGGRHTEMLLDMGFKTSILDLNPQMLRCTIKRVGRSRLASVAKGSITRLPFKDQAFDVVVTTGVLHQARSLHEYELAIGELARTVKAGGVVCLNIFTSSILDETYIRLPQAFVYQTKEGLDMSLLPKSTFYELMNWYGLALEEEVSEDVVDENTGKRSVLRCNFMKK